MMIIEVGKGDIDTACLTRCQADAAAGRFAESLAGFLQWLAPQYEKVRGMRPDWVAKQRSEMTHGQRHARTPANAAELFFGFALFLTFAEEIGSITAAERQTLRQRCQIALSTVAQEQESAQAAHEPTQHFIRLLLAALSSGRAHMADIDGTYPEAPTVYGWRKRLSTNGTSVTEEWQPQGRRVGWVDDEDLFLEPDAAYSEANKLAGEQGESLAVSATTLRKRLQAQGYLVTTDTNRETLTVRKMIEGTRKNVLHLSGRVLIDGENPTTERHKPDHGPTTENPKKTGEEQELVGSVGSCTGVDGHTNAENRGRDTGSF